MSDSRDPTRTKDGWYIVAPGISEDTRAKLTEMRLALTRRNAAITANLNRVAELCAEGAVAYDRGDFDAARANFTAACDLEFATLGECEASGDLVQKLMPGE